MADTHQRFLESLRASDRAVGIVRRWLEGRGMVVEQPPLREAPRAEEWREYTDKGDLFVTRRLDVKGLTVAFTSAGDWPFADYLVMQRRKFDEANPKPWAIVSVNAAETHVGIVMGRDRGRWRVRESTDRRFGTTREHYVTDVENVQFCSLRDLGFCRLD